MFEVNREAVIAIQGGGVFALSLLGQAKAVIEKQYVPLAFAGTSGGAILACLLWSGLNPDDIEAEFIEMLQANPQALVDLVGAFEPPPRPRFDLDTFDDLQGRVVRLVTRVADQRAGRLRRGWNVISSLPAGWGLWGRIKPHVMRRGFFVGNTLEEKIDRLIRKGFGRQRGMPPLGTAIRFRDVDRMMRDSRGAFYRPPLLLTATNLTRRRLDVISSIDPRYFDVPVAAAVRASAGFPIFFRPKMIQGAPGGDGWFVDGGVVANFPVWTFSDAFREQIAVSELYRPLATKPWVRIGLRVVDDAEDAVATDEPKPFLTSLVSMLTGAARNELENILAGRVARSIVIKQPTSSAAGPTSILDVKAIDARKIREMVALGFQQATQELNRVGSPGIYSGDSRPAVERELGLLVAECRHVLGANADGAGLRANIFVPIEDRLKMVFWVNFADADRDRGLEFPDLKSGFSGTCYQLRSRLVCNLRQIATFRRADPNQFTQLLGMSEQLQERIRPDRTWLASTPIFDPYEIKASARRAGAVGEHGLAYHDVGIEIDGPLLGVLNVDAAWDYNVMALNPDPHLHYADSRIQAILDIMHTKAMTIGRHLAAYFPAIAREPDHE